MKTETLILSGMTCAHCVESVTKQLKKLPLENIQVKVGAAMFDYDETKVSLDEIKKVLAEDGYKVVA